MTYKHTKETYISIKRLIFMQKRPIFEKTLDTSDARHMTYKHTKETYISIKRLIFMQKRPIFEKTLDTSDASDVSSVFSNMGLFCMKISLFIEI